MKTCLLLLGLLLLAGTTVHALDICLPTANTALLKPGHDAEFFQPTVEGTTESGMFGCVRRNGHKFHEGLDIRCLQRDRRGEPLDPVHAVAAGEVAFINAKPGLSNYGRYIVLAHRWDGVAVYTLYAHLSAIADGLVAGQPVAKGQVIATLGHSTNTREGIPSERAHLHFEIDFMLNTNFHIWYPKHYPKAPPFGDFNGQNLIGLNAADFYRAIAANPKLNFAQYVAHQTIAFSVFVRARPFPWLTEHPEQTQRGPEAPVAYEIGVTAWGFPVGIWPRAATELNESQRRLVARGLPVSNRVNETELDRNGCRDLVKKAGSSWQLTNTGKEWMEILTYAP